MSLLSSTETPKESTGVSPMVAHCNHCGQDYYLVASPNQTFVELVASTICPCGDSQIVAKGTTNGSASVETL